MLKRSISSTLASPSAQTALARSLTAISSRTSADRRLESSSAPSSRVDSPPSDRIAAQATTGRQGPKPRLVDAADHGARLATQRDLVAEGEAERGWRRRRSWRKRREDGQQIDIPVEPAFGPDILN